MRWFRREPKEVAVGFLGSANHARLACWISVALVPSTSMSSATRRCSCHSFEAALDFHTLDMDKKIYQDDQHVFQDDVWSENIKQVKSGSKRPTKI